MSFKISDLYKLLADNTGKTAEEISIMPVEEFAVHLKAHLDNLGTAERETIYKELLKPDTADKRFESFESIANMLEYLTDKNVSTEFRKATGALQNKLAAREQSIAKLEQRIQAYEQAGQKLVQPAPMTRGRLKQLLAKTVEKHPDFIKEVKQILSEQRQKPINELPELNIDLWKSTSNRKPEEWAAVLEGKNRVLASAPDVYKYARTLLLWSEYGTSMQISKAYEKAEEFQEAESIVTSTKVVFNNRNQGRIIEYNPGRIKDKLTKGSFPFERCDVEDSIRLTQALRNTSFVKELFDTDDSERIIIKALCFLLGADSEKLRIVAPGAENKREQSYVTFITESGEGIIGIESMFSGKAYALK